MLFSSLVIDWYFEFRLLTMLFYILAIDCLSLNSSKVVGGTKLDRDMGKIFVFVRSVQDGVDIGVESHETREPQTRERKWSKSKSPWLALH